MRRRGERGGAQGSCPACVGTRHDSRLTDGQRALTRAHAARREREHKSAGPRLLHLGDVVELERRLEGVHELHVLGEGGQHEVAHLEAARGDVRAQRDVVRREDGGEVVEEREEDAEEALVERAHGRRELALREQRLQELQEALEEAREALVRLGPLELQATERAQFVASSGKDGTGGKRT